MISISTKISKVFLVIETLHQQFKILHMSKTFIKKLFGNIQQKSIIPQIIYSTYYINILKYTTYKYFININNKIMDPFLEMCLAPTNNNNSRHDYFDESKLLADVNNLPQKFRYGMSKKKYKEIRYWKPVDKGLSENNCDFILRILSYNILAQNLLETHSYLYNYHHHEALNWKIRKILIQQEIKEADANIICIQEMQIDHLQEFLSPFLKNGYDYLYKKRTNDTRDGLLLLYKKNQFKIEDHAFVEYHQTTADILNRDNVGIIVKFSLKENPDVYFVVSTTHLLYNPKRNDVRLAQTQILFSELERISFNGNSVNGSKYHPIIVCGDFNLKPYSGVYEFLTEGYFKYSGKGRTLEDSGFWRLGSSLIPSSLYITDNCQHFNVLTQRFRGQGNNKVMLQNSDIEKSPQEENEKPSNSQQNEVDIDSTKYQNIKIADNTYAKFASGIITHPFKLKSVYKHSNYKGLPEASTNQGDWINVDYIFYNGFELLNRYRLPTVDECSQLPSIPNFVVGSDHLCLGATFKLKVKK